MGKIDMKQTALNIAKAYEVLTIRYLVLNSLLDEKHIQVSESFYDEYLRDHPALAQSVHGLIQPLYDAVEQNEDLGPALKALLSMPPRGQVQ